MKAIRSRWMLVTGVLLMMAPAPAHAQPDITLAASIREGATLALDAEGTLVVMGNGVFLDAIDVTDPEAPVLVDRLDLGRLTYDLALNGGRAYLRFGDSVRIVDASDPTTLTLRGVYERTVRDIDVDGDFLYASGSDSLFVVDVSDPDEPTQVGAFAANNLHHLHADYPFVYGAQDYGSSFFIFDVTDPAAPFVRKTVSDGGEFWELVHHRDGVLFVASVQSLHAYDVSDPDNPEALGSVDVPGTRLFNVETLGSDGDFTYLRRLEEVYVFDSAEPAAMTLVAEVDVAYGTEAAFVGAHAYIGGNDMGLQILDTADPSAPHEVGRFENGGALREATSDGDLLYLSGGFYEASESIRTYRLDEQAEPQFLARADVADWGDLRVRGSLGYATYLWPGLFVYGVLAADLSDPAAPTVLSTCSSCGGQQYTFTGVALGDSALFLNSTFDGVYSVDIRDPMDLRLVDREGFSFPGGALAVTGDIALAVSYGTDVLNVADPSDMRPIDHLDLQFQDMVFSPPLAYATTEDGCVSVLDLSDPRAVTRVHDTCPLEIDYLSSLEWFDGALYATGGQNGNAALFRFGIDDPDRPTFEATTFIRAGAQDLAAVENRLIVPYSLHGFDVFAPTDPTSVAPNTPALQLLALTPNPFHDTLEIGLELQTASDIRIEVFDVLGRRLAELLREPRPAGRQVVRWTPGASLPAGIYLVRVWTEGATLTRRVSKL